ncbi:MAG: head completion/stabilization protein [Pseudomonadota bacterium]
MTGFVAMPPPPQSPDGAMIEADGWFPAIDANAMRDSMLLRIDVPHARLVAAIHGALLSATMDLTEWKAGHVAAGAIDLGAVSPDATIGGQHRLTLLFVRAVRFAAAAELADLARDSAATPDAIDRLADEPTTAAEMRRQYISAIRDILSVTRVAVELI